jgi:hypothetical protein
MHRPVPVARPSYSAPLVSLLGQLGVWADEAPGLVVAAPLPLAGSRRKHRMAEVQRLDLRLLINTENHGVLRRGHVLPYHIAHIGHEVGIGGDLEDLLPMWPRPEGTPNPLYGAD